MVDLQYARLPPFKHQEEDVESLVDNPFFFIMSQMRTGKTKIVIDAAQVLFRRGLINRVIVLAPAPVRDVWYEPEMGELQKHLWFSTQADVVEYHARIRQWEWRCPDERPFPGLMQWVISNYEFIRSVSRLTQLTKLCTPKTLLVLDESSAIKNYAAQTTKACTMLRYLCGRVVELNGTPLSHSPLDLFSQGNILHPSVLDCRYITHFKARYAVMGGYEVHGRPTQIVSWKNLEDLQKRFAPYSVRRLQKDCLDMLPAKLPAVSLTATLTQDLWKLYREMRDDAIVYLENSTTASLAPQAVTKILRLSQLTSGFLGGVQDISIDEPEDLEDNELAALVRRDVSFGITPNRQYPSDAQFEGVREVGREKLDVVLWLLHKQFEEDENLKIVVWVRFRSEHARMMREVEAWTKKHAPRCIVTSIAGGQKKKDRREAIKLLHPDTAPPGPVFFGGTYGTGSKGLNFTAAHTSVNCSYDSSLEKFLQGNDRVYGPGQTQPVAYYDIVAQGPKGQKTIDHVIVKARREREDLANWTQAAWIKALRSE